MPGAGHGFYGSDAEQTIAEVILLGHADSGAETMANEEGTVRIEVLSAK